MCDKLELSESMNSMNSKTSVQHENSRKEITGITGIPSKKKKVWVKLKNGLYGWHIFLLIFFVLSSWIDSK